MDLIVSHQLSAVLVAFFMLHVPPRGAFPRFRGPDAISILQRRLIRERGTAIPHAADKSPPPARASLPFPAGFGWRYHKSHEMLPTLAGLNVPSTQEKYGR